MSDSVAGPSTATAIAGTVLPNETLFHHEPYVVAAQWAELGEATAAVGLLDACARYYRVLLPLEGMAVVIAAAVGFGPAVDHHLGVLAAALGPHRRRGRALRTGRGHA